MPGVRNANCPSREELLAFSLGTVSQKALETISEHVRTCDDCVAALSAIQGHDDSLLSGIRKPSSAEQFLDEPEYQRAVERARVIGYGPSVPESPDLQPPRPVPSRLGRYEVLEQLGHGGMGTVYLARDTQLDREVALKIPHFRGGDDPGRLERFYREARAAATIEHPNLCPVYDVGEIDGIAYLSMARVRGKSLSRLLKGGKRFSEREAAEIVRKLALAVDKAHRRGVVHRDIKPSNVMMTEGGEPILTDFGLAQRLELEDPRLTRSGVIVGTPSYMAPEQVDGDLDTIGPRCDVYSLGVVLYELLTGRLPFEGPLLSVLTQLGKDQPAPPSTHRPGLDRRLETICLKALAKSPADRFPTAADLGKTLERYLEGGPEVERLFFRRRWLGWLGAAAVCAAIIVAAWLATVLRPAGFADDFEDNWINPDHWVSGGTKRGWNLSDPADQGSWSHSIDETRYHADDPDGYLQVSVEGPQSLNTYGAEAWLRSTRDYNDGKWYTVNFTWAAEVSDGHCNEYYVQITDGYVAPDDLNDIDWAAHARQGTADLLWWPRPGRSTEKRGKRLPSDVEKSTWSIVLDPSGTAKLYDGPNASGSLVRSEALQMDAPWFVRFMVMDSTSKAFPPGDSSKGFPPGRVRLELYHFEVLPEAAK